MTWKWNGSDGNNNSVIVKKILILLPPPIPFPSLLVLGLHDIMCDIITNEIISPTESQLFYQFTNFAWI